MTEIEFQTAMQEFLNNGGVVEQVPYSGPRFTERTFIQRGYVWATGATKAALKDAGIRK